MNTTEKIVSAIVARKKLQISYKDKTETKFYIVNPHLLGKMKASGNIVLSAYEDGIITGCWKTFLLANITYAEMLDEKFENTAPNYNPLDSRMSAIICAIPSVQ